MLSRKSSSIPIFGLCLPRCRNATPSPRRARKPPPKCVLVSMSMRSLRPTQKWLSKMVYLFIDYPHLQEPIHYHLTKRLKPTAGCLKKSSRIAFGKKSIKNLLLKINKNPFWRILNMIFERFLREANPPNIIASSKRQSRAGSRQICLRDRCP